MKKKAQVWVETVIYTLIGLSIIAAVLAIITPKIQETKDKAVIDQSLDILDSLSRNIDEIKFAPGNSWPVQVKFDKGKFVVDGVNDQVYFLFEDSKVKYSQEGEEIVRGRIHIMTTKVNRNTVVKLSLNYTAILNITYQDSDRVQTFQSAALPYDLFVEHKGKNAGSGLTQINFNS